MGPGDGTQAIWCDQGEEALAMNKIKISREESDAIAKQLFEELRLQVIVEKNEEIEALRDKLNEIKHWCMAYPIDIFPEPDFKEARKLLEAGGMTIDAISASNMRHVTTGIQKIIDGDDS